MDVDAEHVAGAVQRPAGVDLGVRVERLLRRHRQQAHALQPVGEHLHRGVVGGEERHAGADRLDAGLLRGVDEVVELALQVGEAAVDRERAGDVGGVEVAVLHAHVEQEQLARGDRAGVLDPVQRGGVLAAADDRVVADVVAHRAGAAEEGALDPALAVLQHAGPTRATESSKPSAVMSQASCSSPISHSSLTSRISEATRAKSSSWVASAATRRSTWAETPRCTRVLPAPSRTAARSSMWRTSRPREVGDLVRRRAGGRPTARRTAGRGRTRRCRARTAAGRRDGLAVVDHEHGVAGLVAGEVGVRGVRPEPVVGVVGPHLEGAGGQHQPLARERLGQPGAAVRGVVGDGWRGRSSSRSPQPVRMNCGPRRGHLGVVGLGLRLGVGWDVGWVCSVTPSLYAGRGLRRRRR